MHRWFLIVALGACKGPDTDTEPSETDADADTDTDTDSDTDTDTDADTDADTDSDTDTDTDTDAEPVPLKVSAMEMRCESETPNLSASVTAPNTVAVVHTAYDIGCCPDFAVTAFLDEGTGVIEAVYDLTNDVCDCACWLQARFQLDELPAGDYTLNVPGGSSTPILVP